MHKLKNSIYSPFYVVYYIVLFTDVFRLDVDNMVPQIVIAANDE